MRALIYGGKISGKGASKLLRELDYKVEFVGDETNVDVLNGADLMVLSPAVPIDKPLVRAARAEGIPVMGELELGYIYSKGYIVAITGTNGKTTTAMMLDSIMREAGKKHRLLGNIGKSFAAESLRMTDDDTTILEVSSYQLESIETFRPHMACVLNLSPDHIERHGSYENYIKTKLDIFENMTDEDAAIICYDDDLLRERTENIKADKYYFSLRESVRGAYILDKVVYFMDEQLFKVSDFHVLGEHNMSNALAAICMAKLLGVKNFDILKGIRNFSLPPHRIQYIGKYRDKNYYNDSKATNIEATISAMKTMRGSTTLIIGGYDKGISYHKLFLAMDKNIRSVIVFGQNRHKIEETLKSFDVRYFVVDSLLKAIERAAKERVQNVLFSPGTSSYDMFTNYEERGDMFIKLVGDINED